LTTEVIPPSIAVETTTPEDGLETATEGLVHEAVGNRVATRRQEGKQVDEVHGDGRDPTHGSLVVEDDPGLKDIHRSPADEELEDDDQQHLHHPPPGDDAFVVARLAHAHSGALSIALPLPRVDVSGSGWLENRVRDTAERFCRGMLTRYVNRGVFKTEKNLCNLQAHNNYIPSAYIVGLKTLILTMDCLHTVIYKSMTLAMKCYVSQQA